MKTVDDNLIVRSLSGDADGAELKELTQKIAASDDTAKNFCEIKNVWDACVSPQIADTIDTRESLDYILKRISLQKQPSLRDRVGNIFLKVAAGLSFPLMLLSGYLYFSRDVQSSLPLAINHEISAMPGSVVHTMLPDSTELWLNGGSSIKYSQVKDEPRAVEINGEAFFKVAKDAEHPFRVSTPSGFGIEAVGTEFNVCSYARDSIAAVTLTEGVVNVHDSKWTYTMSPRQTVVYNSNRKKGVLYLGNTDKNISWRDGRLAFNNEPLKNVFKRIGLVYDADFEVDDRLSDAILHATFERASFDEMLSLIQKSTPLTYQVREETTDGRLKRIIKVKAK